MKRAKQKVRSHIVKAYFGEVKRDFIEFTQERNGVQHITRIEMMLPTDADWKDLP